MTLLLALLLVGPFPRAHADVKDPGESSLDGSLYPAGPHSMEYPGIQRFWAPSLIYVDHTYQESDDLNTLDWVKGRGSNYRLAVGAIYRTSDFAFSMEIPFQYTRLSIDSLQGNPPVPEDQQKGAFSLGDITLAVAYAIQVSEQPLGLSLGLGMRLRAPTHTTKFGFGLMNGGYIEFGIPYYVHAAPTVIVTVSNGPLALTVNQGVLAMLAKDTKIGDLPQPVPNIYFWEAHYALSLNLGPWGGLWVEVVHCHQLNAIDVFNFEKVNNLEAVSLNPGFSFAWEGYQVVLEGRYGMTQDSRDFGVITFSGNKALLIRISHLF